jgi:hypothetical protein
MLFINNYDAPFTNNQAERDLRPFVTNPSTELLEKVELVINFGFHNPKLLKIQRILWRENRLLDT